MNPDGYITQAEYIRRMQWNNDVLSVTDSIKSEMMHKMEEMILDHFDMDMSDLREYMHDKIAWERKQELKSPKWIPVTTMLPKDGCDVIAWIEDEYESRMTAANYDHGVWCDCVMNCREHRVKYWMFPPDPPKEHINVEFEKSCALTGGNNDA